MARRILGVKVVGVGHGTGSRSCFTCVTAEAAFAGAHPLLLPFSLFGEGRFAAGCSPFVISWMGRFEDFSLDLASFAAESKASFL